MAESWSDSELETRKELTRKSGRARKVTERLQVDPRYKTYERKTDAVIMTRRKCTRTGCDYVVGQGDGPDIPVTFDAEMRDLEAHIEMNHKIGGNLNNMKDPKIPVWVSGQSYESWVQNFVQWQNNVKYADQQYVDRLTSMLKDPHTNKKVSDYFVKDLNEDRVEVRNTCQKILDRLKERFGRSELRELEVNIEKFRIYKFEETAIDSLNTLETIRGHWNAALDVERDDVTVPEIKANIDKIFKSVFVTEGRKNGGLSDEKAMFVRKAIAEKTAWTDFRESVKTFVTEYEQPSAEVLLMGRDKDRGRSRHRSGSRDDRRSSKSDRSYRARSSSWKKDGHAGQFGQPGQQQERERSPGKDLLKKTTISDDVATKLGPKLGKMEDDIRKNTATLSAIKEAVDKICANQIHYIEPLDIYWVDNPGAKMGGIMDVGAVLTASGLEWMEVYVKKNGLDWNNLRVGKSGQRFRFGDGSSMPTEMTVVIPVSLTDVNGEMKEMELKVWVVKANIPLLIGKDVHVDLNMCTEPATETCKLGKEDDRRIFKLENTAGGHWGLEFNDLSQIMFVDKEEDDDNEVFFDAVEEVEIDECGSLVGIVTKDPEILELRRKVKSLHRSNHHKSIRNMLDMYKGEGRLITAVLRKTVEDVVNSCETCQLTKRSNSVPKVSGVMPARPNDILTLDLKFFEKIPVLWMIDAFSRFALGVVLKSKEMDEVVRNLENEWFMKFGKPSTRLWTDNGLEFSNKAMAALVKKWGLQIKFGPPYAPFSNGINERNHASADKAVERYLIDNPRAGLQEAVNVGAWTHNTNTTKEGFVPYRVMFGYDPSFPGFEVPEADEREVKTMEKHLYDQLEVRKAFLENEFKRRIKIGENQRLEKYYDETYKAGDLVYFQEKMEKCWRGPVKVLEQISNSEVHLDVPEARGGFKRVHKCKISRVQEDIEEADHVSETDRDKEICKDDDNRSVKPILTRSKARQLRFQDQEEDFIEKARESEANEVFRVSADNIVEAEPEMDLFDLAIYSVELSVKEHGREDVKEAKMREIENLESYDVYERVEDKGQVCVGARWVVTEKQGHDGQKMKVKARLVARGFQEIDKEQSDSPTAQRESLRLFLAAAANIGVQSLRSIDISAAYLQSDELNRDVFLEVPKDIREDGTVWKLNKPLYGLTDAGRKFWISFKKWIEKNGYERMNGDNAFYYKRVEGELVGMILLHVDDVIIAGNTEFVDETTRMIGDRFNMSKICNGEFRFCGLDIKLQKDGKITVSMDDYADSIEPMLIDRKRKRTEEITYKEISALRELVGKLAWLAQNIRPDMCYGAVYLQKRVSSATVADVLYANKLVEKGKAKKNEMHFVRVGNKDDLVMYGLGDASYTAGEGKNSALGGQFVILGTEKKPEVSSLFWKSKSIKVVCKSPKDAETINNCIVCDKARHLANQMSDLLFGRAGRRIPVVVFTDSLGTLESVASTKQVERNLMRQHVFALQSHLEGGEVWSLNWLPDELMVSDILTKEMKTKDGLDSLMYKNRLGAVITRDNSVMYRDNEFEISGRRLREKLAPKKNPPMKKKVKK